MHTVRAARPEDAIAIADVHIASWRGAYKGIIPDAVLDEILNRRDLERRWSRMLIDADPPGSEALLICVDDAVVGFARFGPARDKDSILRGGTGEIYGFYLHPDRWGRGLGRDLMRAVLDDLVERGYAVATLNVLEANDRARLFYERGGWVLDAEAAPWYGQPQVRYRMEL